MKYLLMINQYDSLTQFHSVTRVDLNSKLAKAKSAFSGHETTTLKNYDDEIKYKCIDDNNKN